MASKPKDEGNIAFSQKTQILIPTPEDALPVPLSHWKTLMKRISACKSATSFSEGFAWAMVGVAGSSFLTAVAFPFSAQFTIATAAGDVVNWVAFVTMTVFSALVLGCGGVAFATFRHIREKRDLQAEFSTWIKEDMQSWMDRHTQARAATATAPPLVPPAAPPEQPHNAEKAV